MTDEPVTIAATRRLLAESQARLLITEAKIKAHMMRGSLDTISALSPLLFDCVAARAEVAAMDARLCAVQQWAAAH